MSWNREHILEVDEDSLAASVGLQGLNQLREDLHRGFQARAVLAEAAMAREKAEIESAPLVTNEGNYRPRTVVSAESFHYWGQRLGYDCWSDPEFLKDYERDNPAAKINAKMSKTTIVNQFGEAAA